MRADAKRPALLAALAASAALLVFVPSLRHGFVALDDPMFLFWHSEWRGLGAEAWRWAFTARVGSVYQPLAWLSYGLDHVLWGLDARGYHAQNALWHAAASGLFFLVSRRLLDAASPAAEGEFRWSLDAGAFFAALVFAVHPLRVESVSWVSERRDVVCGALSVAAILAYLRARSPGLEPRPLAPVLGLFALALLAKGMALTLPAVLLVIDLYPLRRIGPRREGLKESLREKWAFFALAALFGVIGALVQTRMRWGWRQHGLAARLAQAAYGLAFYARKTLWPSGLSPMYELRPPLDLTQPRFLLSAAAVAAAAWGCWRLRRSSPWAAAACAAYALMLAPVSGLFQFGPQLVADRYSYLPCLPFAVLAGAALRGASARRRSAALAAGALAAAALAAASVRQQAFWRGTEELWARALEGDPGSGAAHLGLGAELAPRGRIEEAKRHFEAALAAFPGCAEDQDRLAALLARGGVASDEGRRLSARVEQNPVCRKARANLGAALAQGGDLRGALAVLRVAAAVAPDDEGARRNLARVERLIGARRGVGSKTATPWAQRPFPPGGSGVYPVGR